MNLDNNTQAFFALLRAGLWEKEVRLFGFGSIDFEEVCRLASQQAVVGLVTAGLEHVTDVSVPKEAIMAYMPTILSMEQRNLAMNAFIGQLFQKMDAAGIKAVLVKGQGIAQCYERPLWRACGDVDLLLGEENYVKAKAFLPSLASNVEEEDVYRRHLAMSIEQWEVELHGTFRAGLWKAMDAMADEVQADVFENGRVRVWHNDQVDVLLPSPDNDVILIFSHILQHFFRGGIGLRQICDWCRLLWTYKEALDLPLLEDRLRRMGVMQEWKALAALAVKWLGMPEEAVPFYSASALVQWRAKRILAFVLETGNFGHNKDVSYMKKYPYVIRKAISLWRHTWDFLRQFFVFPLDAMRAWRTMIKEGFGAVAKGK